MKKIILSLFALAAMGLSANAQQVVKFGPKAGVNFANLSGDDIEDSKMKTSFHVGAFAEIFFTDKFAIQPEVLFSAQGAEEKEGDGKWNLDYINIPIMAKYYVIDGLAVEAGPYVGFNMNSELESEGVTMDVKDGTKSVDFGLGLGANYNLDNGFFIGARYNLGLSEIGKSSEQTVGGITIETEGPDAKNSVIQISVGYKF